MQSRSEFTEKLKIAMRLNTFWSQFHPMLLKKSCFFFFCENSSTVEVIAERLLNPSIVGLSKAMVEIICLGK